MINIAPSRTLMERTPAFLGKAVLLAGFGFALLVVGVACALFPQLAARLAPFLLLGVVFFVALLASKDQPLSERFRLWWLTALVIVFALWPTYMIIKVGGLPALDARRIVAGISLVIMFYMVVSRSSTINKLFSKDNNALRGALWLVGGFSVLRIISCFSSPAPIASLINVGWEFVYYYLMFFLAAIFFSDKAFAFRFSKTVLWMAVLIAIYAIFERISERNILVEISPKLESLENLALSLSQSRIRDGSFRVQGTFEHPLLLAEFSAIAFCIALSTVLWKSKQIPRVLAVACLVFCPLAVWFSGSRAGFIALGAGAGLIVLLKIFSAKKQATVYQNSARKIAFVITALTAILIIAPTITLIAQGRSATEGASTEARLLMIKLALPSVKEAPLIGNGPGTSGTIAGIKTTAGITTLDNYLIAVAVESGMLALFVFVLIFIYPAWKALSVLLSGRAEVPYFLAATAGVLAVAMVFRSILWIPYNLSFVFIMIGILTAPSLMGDKMVKAKE